MLPIYSVLFVATFGQADDIKSKLDVISKGLDSTEALERRVALTQAEKLKEKALPVVPKICRLIVSEADESVTLAAVEALRSIKPSLAPIALDFRSIRTVSGVRPHIEKLIRRMQFEELSLEDAKLLVPMVLNLLGPLERDSQVFQTHFDAEVGLGSIASFLLILGDTSETHVRIANFLLNTRNMVARDYGLKSAYFLIGLVTDKTPFVKTAEEMLKDKAVQLQGMAIAVRLGAAAKPLLPTIKSLSAFSDRASMRLAAAKAVERIERAIEKEEKKK